MLKIDGGTFFCFFSLKVFKKKTVRRKKVEKNSNICTLIFMFATAAITAGIALVGITAGALARDDGDTQAAGAGILLIMLSIDGFVRLGLPSK